MFFAIIAFDKPDKLALRIETRPKHLEHLDAINDRIRVAGPILTDGEDPTPRGTLYIIEADDIDQARGIANREPYTEAGIFESLQVVRFLPGRGSWLNKVPGRGSWLNKV